MRPREILIVKPSSMGDVLQTLPAVHCLKRAYPEAKLRWIVNAQWAPLLAGNPDLEAIIPFPRGCFRGIRGAVRAAAWTRTLSRLRPDLALDFQGLLRSAFLSRAARPRRLLGLGDAREGSCLFYDRIAGTRMTQHAVARYLALAALAGADASGDPVFWLPAGQPLTQLKLPATYLLLHPFARGHGKSLAPPEVSRLVQALAPWPVLVVGVSEQGVPALPGNAISLVNQTNLLQLIFLIRRAAFMVSVDSGPMHLAAALTDRLLSMHFWSDPRQVGPCRPDAWIWKQARFARMRDLAQTAFQRRSPTRPDAGELAQFLHERLLHAVGPAV
jgi:heptosyltransferase I